MPGVIFDVDGVLVDSFTAHRESWRRLATELGWPFSESRFAETFGCTSREVIRLWSDQPLDEATVKALDDRKEAYYRELLQAEFPTMAGAREIAAALVAARFAIAVGSSGPAENVRAVLDVVDPMGRIEVRVSGDDVRRGKPDPEVFVVAGQRLGLAPEACVVIEDAPAGIEAAHGAGMRCVGLASTGRTRNELDAAELVVDNLAALSPALLRDLLDRGR